MRKRLRFKSAYTSGGDRAIEGGRGGEGAEGGEGGAREEGGRWLGLIDTNSPFRPGKSSRPVKLCVSRMRDVTHGYAPVQINGTTDWFSRSCRSTVWNKKKKKKKESE